MQAQVTRYMRIAAMSAAEPTTILWTADIVEKNIKNGLKAVKQGTVIAAMNTINQHTQTLELQLPKQAITEPKHQTRQAKQKMTDIAIVPNVLQDV